MRKHCPDTPIVLVGTKLDVRESPSRSTSQDDLVTQAQAERVVKRMNLSGYFETSAKLQKNVNTVFYKAVEVIVEGKKKPVKKKAGLFSFLSTSNDEETDDDIEKMRDFKL